MPPPSVFISYAQETLEHQQWVIRLGTSLRQRGVDVRLDRWDLQIGHDIAEFMDRNIADANFLLLVCTETFAEKANARRGGVGYEQRVITGELLTDPAAERKLLPILRHGTPASALPQYLRTRLFVDFRENEQYDSAVEQVVRHVHGVLEHQRPPIGSPPAYVMPNAIAPSTESPAKWVLVAGTGVAEQYTDEMRIAAEGVGRQLAAGGYGLVTGGWPCVDATVARSYVAALSDSGAPLENFLVQVVAADQVPEFPAGNLVLVRPGSDEWTEAIRRADAVILIGGLGGTLTTGELALQRQKTVLPLADTGGDAKTLYVRMLSHWDAGPVTGIDESQFQRLARPVRMVINELLPLLKSTIGAGLNDR